MIGTVHHKLYALGNGTKLADNQFVAYKVVEVSDVLLKQLSTIHIVIVGVITDDNTWILRHILNITEARNFGIRKSLIWIGSLICHR